MRKLFIFAAVLLAISCSQNKITNHSDKDTTSIDSIKDTLTVDTCKN